jgi:hypothetical protein
MSHYEATKILDKIKDGADYTLATINQALFLTGDIDEHQFSRMDGSYGSAGMDCAIQPQGNIAGSSRSTQLVDRCN